MRPRPGRLPEDRVGRGVVAARSADLDAQGAIGGDDVLARVAQLVARGGPELLAGHQRAQHRHDRGVVLQVDLRQPLHQRPRRVVAHELGRQPLADVLGGQRVVREVAEVLPGDLAAVGLAVLVGEPLDLHLAGRVVLLDVRRLPRLPEVDVVAGQDPRRRLDVVLVVVAGAERVQLEQLAPEVLVGSALGRRRGGEEDQHRRVGRGRGQQLVEATERVAPDRVAVVHPPGEVGVAAHRHVEHRLPELGHLLQHRAPRADAPHEQPAAVVLHDLPAAADLLDLALPEVGGPPVEVGPPPSDGVSRPVRERARAGELLLEPCGRPAGTAYVARERRVDAVAEARHEVTLRRGQQSRPILGHRGPPVPEPLPRRVTVPCRAPDAKSNVRIPVARRPAGAVGWAGGHRRADRGARHDRPGGPGRVARRDGAGGPVGPAARAGHHGGRLRGHGHLAEHPLRPHVAAGRRGRRGRRGRGARAAAEREHRRRVGRGPGAAHPSAPRRRPRPVAGRGASAPVPPTAPGSGER